MKTRLLKIVVFILLLFIIVNNIIFVPANILSWDVFGYYLYLPAKFIYHDLGLRNHGDAIHSVIEKYHSTASFYQAVQTPEGNYVFKYSMGLSVLYAPFFFIGHLIAKIFGYPTDGFSIPYQYSIFVGGIIYSILGILVLVKVLIRFFSEKITAILLCILVFSTNYIIHITMYGQNAMSHNYLFTAYALILWFTIRWHETYKWKYIVLLGIVCGLSILSRPSEIVCLIIPLLWGVHNKETFFAKFKMLLQYRFQILVFLIILILIGSFQFMYWKAETGKYLYNSYGANPGEGFEFLSPHISDFLFSFRKGWLIYTPVMIFALVGLFILLKRNKLIFFVLFVHFIFTLYILSSWSCWWYATSFGQRVMIPYYPLLAVTLGYFIVWLNERKKLFIIIGYSFFAIFLLLNIFQSTQSYYGIISLDRMTKDYYFRIFGKMHASDEDKKLLLVGRSFDGVEIFNNESEYNSRVIKKMDFENSEKRDSTVAYSGKYSFRLDSPDVNSPSIEYPYYKLTNKDHAWIRITAYVFPTCDVIDNPFSLVVHFNHKEFPYKYTTYGSDKMKLELNKWNRITFDYLTPEVRSKEDKLKVHFFLSGKEDIFVDDIQIEVFEKK